MAGNSFTLNAAADAITCHVCGLTSHHPEDVKWRYCGSCHRFHTDTATVYIYTIYEDPADYPGEFVLRRFRIGPDGVPLPEAFAVRGASLAEARRELPIGAVSLGRHPTDEPQIVESWI